MLAARFYCKPHKPHRSTRSCPRHPLAVPAHIASFPPCVFSHRYPIFIFYFFKSLFATRAKISTASHILCLIPRLACVALPYGRNARRPSATPRPPRYVSHTPVHARRDLSFLVCESLGTHDNQWGLNSIRCFRRAERKRRLCRAIIPFQLLSLRGQPW